MNTKLESIESPLQIGCQSRLQNSIDNPSPERGAYRSPKRSKRARDRRGAAAVFGLVLMLSLIALAGVVVDLGYINVSRTELTRTADAAAMAGAWELYEAKQVGSQGDVQSAVGQAAQAYSAVNLVAGKSSSVLTASDGVELGTYDPSSGTFALASSDVADAVRVNIRLNDSENYKIPLFFGALTGRNNQALQVSAIAAMQKSVIGFYEPDDSSSTIQILPIALDKETWQKVIDGETPDDVAFSNGSLSNGSDGYHECSLYPTGTGSPGNRGTVDIGSSNNSTSDLRRQITDGISKQDFVDLGFELVFNDAGHLELNGDTGISAGIKSQLADIVGQKRIIPIFESVSGNGNNAMYKIVAWEGIRVLSVKLTGPMSKKHLTIQPAPMVARKSRLAVDGSQTSQFLYSPVMLVQ